MSVPKIQKQIGKLKKTFNQHEVISKTPIILSDSKGLRLEQHVDIGFQRDIIWWCKPGATCEDRVNFLKNHLEKELQRHPKIVLYVWIGNCNLTTKDRADRFIHLTSTTNNSAVKTVTDNLRNIYNYTSQFDNVDVVFLEIPPYSILYWNSEHQRQPFSSYEVEQFKKFDRKLEDQIEEVNRFIRDTNRITKKRSPRFSLDLVNCKRGRDKKGVLVSRYSYNFCALYQDGIHPCPVLAKYWFLQLCKLIATDCK